MAVSISSIKVEASLDAGSYLSGARAKVEADAQMVASGERVNSSQEQTERRLGQSATALERLTRSIDPAYSAQQKLEAGQQTLQRAFDAGIIKQDEFARRLDLLRDKYSGNVASLQSYATALNSISEVQQRVNAVASVKDDFSYETRVKDIQAYSTELDNLRAKYSPLFAAQQAYAKAQADVNAAFKVGALSEREHFDALSKTKDVYDAQVATIKGVTTATGQHAAQLAKSSSESKTNADAINVSTRAFGLNRAGLQELQAAGINSFQALSSGIGVWRVAQTEGAQVLGAFVQGGVLSFATIAGWGGIFLGVAAAVGVFAAGISRALTTQQQIKNFQVGLEALGTSGKATGESLQTAFQHIRDSGSSAADALEAINIIRRNPIIDPSQAEDIIKLARDIASVTGDALPAATQKYVTALTRGRENIIDYAFSLNVLTADQAKHIRATNDTSIAIDAINAHFANAKDKSLGPFGEILEKITKEWDTFVDEMAKGSVVSAVLRGVKNEIESLKLGVEAIESAIGSLGAVLDKVGAYLAHPVDMANRAAGAAQQDLAQALRERDPTMPESEIANVLRGGGPASQSATGKQGGVATLLQGGATDRLTAALIQTESGGNPNAVSPAGAIGLTQLMPGTAQQLGVNPWDPAQNVEGGMRYLQQQIQQFGSVSAGLQAYNWGPGNYQQYLQGNRQLPQSVQNYSSRIVNAAGLTGNETVAQLATPTAGAPQSTQYVLEKQNDLLDKRNVAQQEANKLAAQEGAIQAANTAFQTSWNSEQSTHLSLENKIIDAWKAYSGVLDQANIVQAKAAAEADRLATGTDHVNEEFRKGQAEGLRAQAVLAATTQVYHDLGNSADNSAVVQQKAGEALRQQAQLAVQSSEAQIRGVDRTTVANEALAVASAKGAAAVQDQQIANQASAQTFDVVAKAQANYAQAVDFGTQGEIKNAEALLARAKAQDEQVRTQIRANEAAKETTQLNLRAEDLKNQTQIIELQTSLQGQSSAEISKQTLLLRTKLDLETHFKDEVGGGKEALLAQTEAIANANIKLEQARAAEGRLNEEITSIADTVTQALGGALDNVLSGKKVTDWGQLFKDTLRSVASTILQTEFVKPLIGSVLSGLGFNNAAQQYGTLGSGGGLLSGLLGLGGLLGGGGSSGGSAGTAAGTGAAAAAASSNFSGTGLSAGDVAAVAADPQVALAAFQAASAQGAKTVPSGGTSSLFNLSNLSSVAGLAKSVLGGGGDLFGGGGFLGGIGSAVNNFGGSLGFAVPGAPFSATIAGPSVPGAASAAEGASTGIFGTTTLTGALGGIGLGAGVGGLLSSVLGGNSLLGSIGGGAGGLAGGLLAPLLFGIGGPIGGIVGGLLGGLTGLLGPKKSTFASGDVVDLASGRIGDVRSSGNAQNDQTVQAISSTLSQFLQSLTAATGGGTVGGSLNVVASTKGIQTHYNGPLGNIDASFASSQEAIQQFELAFIHNIQNVSDTLKSVFAQVTDPSQLQDAINAAKAYEGAATAFDSLFSSIETTTDATGPYQKILDQINTQYQTLSDSANKYGLSLAPLQDSYAAAQQRLITDFNKNIGDALSSLTDPFQQVLKTEIDQAKQRVSDAEAIGGDLRQVEKLNGATLEKAALQASAQLGVLGQRVDDFVGTLGDSLTTLFTSVETQVAHLFTSGAGVSQLSGGDAFSTAYNSIQQQVAAVARAAADSFSSPDVLSVVQDAIQGVARAALTRLATAFNASLAELSLTATNPVQEAINREYIAGQQRVSIAQTIGADINAVEKFNQDNLLRVATAARQAVGGIVTAADAIKTAGTALSGSISSVVQNTDGPFKQALDSLNIGFGKLIGQIDQLSNSTADVTPVLQAYADQIDKLRLTFNNQISQLTLALTDPVQAALNAELDAGKKRIADAQAIGADLAAVDEYNRLSLLKVFQDTQGAVSDTSATLQDFTNSLDSLQGALAQLTSGNLSGLTPAKAVDAALQNFRSELALVKGGATSEIPNLTQAGTGAVTAAQQAYGNSPETAKVRAEIVESLRQVAVSTGTEATMAASGVVVTASNQAQVKATLDSEALAARKVADQIQAQADIERKRTGNSNVALQTQADATREIANQLQAQADQAGQQVTAMEKGVSVTNAFTATLSQQYAEQANKLRAIADQLQDQANIEFQRTGLRDNVYQQESNGARALAGLLDQQANAQSLTVVQLQEQAAVATALAAQLHVQADAEFARTGVKRNLLQQEGDLATQIAGQLTNQANQQGATTQADVDRTKLSIAQLQQQSDIAGRTVAAQASGADAAVGTAGAAASGYDLALEQLKVQRDIAAQANAIAVQEINAQVSIANQVLLAQKAAADAFTAAVNAYAAAVAQAQAAAQAPPPPPAQPAPQVGQAAVPAASTEPQWDASLAGSFLASHGSFHAGGTSNTAPGWIMVGEQGPEWLYQGGGNKVLPTGAPPPAAANDDLVAELKRLQAGIDALAKQMQGGQVQANRDAKMIAEETATVGRKVGFGVPTRRNVA